MSLLKYVGRFKKMDELIRRRATGSPDEFARKLEISKSMLMINLNELKQIGAPLRYSFIDQTYFYSYECRLKIGFEIEKDEVTVLRGGRNIFEHFTHSNNIRMDFSNFNAQGLNRTNLPRMPKSE
jgi:hypothetical protein